MHKHAFSVRTVDDAGALLAASVRLREKQAAPDMAAIRAQLAGLWDKLPSDAKNALIGGGIGAGTGLAASALRDDDGEGRDWGRNALLGGLLGAGAGYAAPKALSAAQELAAAPAETEDPVKVLKGLVNQGNKPAPASSPGVPAPSESGATPAGSAAASPSSSSFNDWITKKFNPATLPPELRKKYDAAMGQLKQQDINPEAVGVPLTQSRLPEIGERIGKGALGGAAAGQLVNAARNKIVTPQDMINFAQDTAAPQLSRMLGNKTLAAELPSYTAGASRPGHQFTAGDGSPIKLPGNMKKTLNTAVRRARKATPLRPAGGWGRNALLGGAAGAAYDWLQQD